jgi:hypothetical protein
VTAVAPTLQAFFTDRLANQKRASTHTIGAYRDTFRLFLAYSGDFERPFRLMASTRSGLMASAVAVLLLFSCGVGRSG